MRYLFLFLVVVILMISGCFQQQSNQESSTQSIPATSPVSKTVDGEKGMSDKENGEDNVTVDYSKDLFDEFGRPIVVIAGSDNGTFDQFGRPQQALGTIPLAAGMSSLSPKGGELYCPSGTNTLTGTLTRAIDNVKITGNGKSSYITINRSTPVIQIGGNGWIIENLKLDEGGISCPTFYHYAVRNVWIGNRYYAYYDTNYQYSRKISINNSTISETLIDFKVCLRLTSSNFDFSLCKSDGSDIYFVGSNGASLCYEIERWDATNQLAEIWIKVPSITASVNTSYFWFYYGNPNAIDQQSSPWDSNYVLVCHMNDLTTSLVKDSAGKGIFYKKAANEPAVATALIGKSQDFDGSNDYIRCENPDGAISMFDTTPLAVTANIYQAIVTPEGNIAYAATRNASTPGIAEFDVKKRKLIFSKLDSKWTTDYGPESISKFPDGNYLTGDCDSGTNIYEFSPNGDTVWTFNLGSAGALCKAIQVDGVDCFIVCLPSSSEKKVKIYRRSDRAEIWTWNAGSYPNDADFRVINGLKKVLVADYQDHTLKIIDYATKATDWSYTLSGVSAGPYNAEWLNDTHVIYSTGNTAQIRIIRTTDNTVTWTSRTFANSTIGCRLWGTDKVVTTNGNGILILDIATAYSTPTSLSVSAIITPDTFATYNTIVGHSNSDASGAGYSLCLRSTGKLQFICYNGAGEFKTIQSNTTLSTGQTYRVRGTLSSGTIKLYINGALDGATPVAVDGGTKDSDYSLAIGSWRNFTGDWFDGKIDEVRIEKRAPSLAEMAAEELNFANTYLSIGTEQFAGVN